VLAGLGNVVGIEVTAYENPTGEHTEMVASIVRTVLP
jgi:hypothetical protein